jgi:drug/metabolite transporter (DMT)-like permease
MWAEQWVHSGITALLLAATPLFTACIEALIVRKTRLKPAGWLALFGGFAGIALLVLSGKGLGSIDLAGAGLVLLAAVCWAAGSVYYKESHPTGSIVVQSGIQMLAAGIVLCVIGMLLGEHHRMHWTLPSALAFAYLVVFGSIVGYGCNMYVLAKWNASRAVTSSYVNPVVAVILGAIVLAEPVNLPMILAMALTIGSVVAVQALKGGYQQRKSL